MQHGWLSTTKYYKVEEREPSSEPDTGMLQILEDRNLK
jgi:hypothetical protein